jgi:NAD/NADP transhydrogenase alpha subunit
LQEKVEEDRYMREQEKKFIENKKKEMTEKMREEDVIIFQAAIAPAMAAIQVMLKSTNDKVSNAGLEAIARWKLDL